MRNKYKYHKIWNKHHPNDLIVPGDGCVIHHKDGNEDNNAPNNLQKIITQSKHAKLHQFGVYHSKESIKKSAKTRKAKLESGEIMPSMLGKHHSEESKRKISESQMGKIIPEDQKRKMSLAAMGRPSPNKGKKFPNRPHPFRGRNFSQAHCDKLSTAHFGNKQTEESKRHISEGLKRAYAEGRRKSCKGMPRNQKSNEEN